ncbi:hypothetical protein ID866_8295 [Astraeus odoratus]|nr:hypothetical protein ID866_8295 [Astraeus odoratus]
MSGVIKVEGNIDFFYEESGTSGLDLSNYTTVVFVPGMGFNGAIFRKLFPFGPSHNYRLVSLYRRGYIPSSPWTEAEISLLNSADPEDGKSYFRLAGLQIAKFLLEFAASQAIPKYNEENQTGGVFLVGWSMGMMYPQAMLANLDALTNEELHGLETYLRAIMYYEAPAVAMGIPQPPPISFDQEILSLPVPEHWAFFCKWVGGFFKHRNPYSRNIEDLEFQHWRTDKPPSLHDVPEDELRKMTSVEMYATHEVATISMNADVLRSVNRRALFNVKMAKYLPKIKVRFVCGTEGTGVFIYTQNEMEKCLQGHPSVVFGEGAEKARDFKLTYLERGNHFVFWEEPQWALEQFSSIMEE